jgi:post-segregation antitoxin (ccd killing protein)
MDTPVVRRCTVRLELKEDTVNRAKALTEDLSGTVEKVLFAWVSREEARRSDPKALEETIRIMDAFHEKHGLLSDEFPIL